MDAYFRQGPKQEELRISETRREFARWRWRWRCEEPAGGSCNDPLRSPGGCTRDHSDNNLRKRRKITPNSQTSVSFAISWNPIQGTESYARNWLVTKEECGFGNRIQRSAWRAEIQIGWRCVLECSWKLWPDERSYERGIAPPLERQVRVTSYLVAWIFLFFSCYHQFFFGFGVICCTVMCVCFAWNCEFEWWCSSFWDFRLVSKLRPFPGMQHLDVAGGTGNCQQNSTLLKCVGR